MIFIEPVKTLANCRRVAGAVFDAQITNWEFRSIAAIGPQINNTTPIGLLDKGKESTTFRPLSSYNKLIINN